MSQANEENRGGNPLLELREQILGASASELGWTEEEPTDVWAAVMEMGYPGAVVTLVALADDTTSLYFSSGGGVIGAGGHESVRAANRAFREAAEAMAGELTPVDGTPMPELGQVVFYVRRAGQTLSGGGHEEDLGEGGHALSPLFHAGHRVISAIREVSPQ